MVRQAPEPEEIIWAHLGVPYRERVWRILGAWIATIDLLSLTLLASILANLKSKELEENDENSKSRMGLVFGLLRNSGDNAPNFALFYSEIYLA